MKVSMKHLFHALAFVAALALIAGCAPNVKPQTPKQMYALAVGDFNAAQAVVLKYESWPPCNGTTPICRNEVTVTKAKAAIKQASDALDAARKTIDDPNFSAGGADAALVVAQNALALLTAITATLPVK